MRCAILKSPSAWLKHGRRLGYPEGTPKSLKIENLGEVFRDDGASQNSVRGVREQSDCGKLKIDRDEEEEKRFS